VDGMIERVEKQLHVNNIPLSEMSNQIQSIKEFMEDVTKITHLLMIIVLSLYRMHKQDVLTVNGVEETLQFLKKIWFWLEESEFEDKRSWQMQVHKLLKGSKKLSYGWAVQLENRY
jgi:hypothetical protein